MERIGTCYEWFATVGEITRCMKMKNVDRMIVSQETQTCTDLGSRKSELSHGRGGNKETVTFSFPLLPRSCDLLAKIPKSVNSIGKEEDCGGSDSVTGCFPAPNKRFPPSLRRLMTDGALSLSGARSCFIPEWALQPCAPFPRCTCRERLEELGCSSDFLPQSPEP